MSSPQFYEAYSAGAAQRADVKKHAFEQGAKAIAIRSISAEIRSHALSLADLIPLFIPPPNTFIGKLKHKFCYDKDAIEYDVMTGDEKRPFAIKIKGLPFPAAKEEITARHLVADVSGGLCYMCEPHEFNIVIAGSGGSHGVDGDHLLAQSLLEQGFISDTGKSLKLFNERIYTLHDNMLGRLQLLHFTEAMRAKYGKP